MGFEAILYEVGDGVATITLNRPERHNAFNVAMAHELREAWARVKRDPAVVCAIVTGAGPRAFCTGMDIGDVASGSAPEESRRTAEGGKPFHRYLTAIQNRCWKPVITAVNGMVVGGGFHFVADSDLVLCAEHATFFDTHVKVGLVAGFEPVGLARRIPLEAVLRLALLGGSERMDAKTAHSLGLVGEVLTAERLLPRARELAATKRAIWESLDVGLEEALERTSKIIESHTDHPDLAEGTRAFVEKRRPRWAPYTS